MPTKPSASQATIPPNPNEAAPGLSPSHPALNPLPAGFVDQVGDYKILGVLGSGGMGIVCKAFDQKLGRIVALKMLHIGVNPDPDALVRIRIEAEALGSLQHPHIVQVFDFGMHNGAPYLVLEFVNGGGLDRKLQGQPQPPRRAAELAELLARAMHAAHQRDIIHRDLKPANIMLTAEGAPKITDFGLAKRLHVSLGLTPTHAVMGTPSYMAPEQAAGKKEVDHKADVYSLGAVLYEMLTGRPPFLGATLQETLEQVQMADPTPPSRLVPKVPRDLQTVCLKCLHKAPGRRYATAEELADDLKNFLEGLPVKARPTRNFERLIGIVARRPLWAALAGAGLLVVILTVFLVLGWFNFAQSVEAFRLENNLNEERAKVQAANQAEKNAQDLLENFQEMLRLTTAGDLHTTEGFQRLEREIENKKKGGTSPQVASVVAGAYYRLAALRREKGEVDRAIELLNRATDLEGSAGGSDEGAPADQLLWARIYQLRGLLRSESGSVEAVKDSTTALELIEGLRTKDAGSLEFKRLQADALHDLAVATSRLRLDSEPAQKLRDLAASRSKGQADVQEFMKEARKAHEARRQNLVTARGTFEKALELLRELVDRSDPAYDDERSLARTLGFLGILHIDLGMLPEADAYLWESHRYRVGLAEDPNTVKDKPRLYESKFQLARSWGNFGRYQMRQRNLESALHFYGQSEKVRLELIQKQPDNMEYVLEWAGVQNRIAEVEAFAVEAALKRKREGSVQNGNAGAEVFAADKERDDKKRRAKTTDPKGRLSKCYTVLEELRKSLEADKQQLDREVYTRTLLCLAECSALRARAELIGLTPALDGKETFRLFETPRSMARTAGDLYEKVAQRQSLNKDELYQRAAARFLLVEISEEIHKRMGQPVDQTRSSYRDEGEMFLSLSILAEGFNRLDAEAIKDDRAFRSVADKDWFKTLLDVLKQRAQEASVPPTPARGPEGCPSESSPSPFQSP